MIMLGSSMRSLTVLSFLALCAVLSACSPLTPGSDAAVETECFLPMDQAKTLAGHWEALPIPIAFEAGDSGFEDSEVAEMVLAVDTWNKFYKASLGIEKVLDYGEDPSNPNIASGTRPTSVCSTGIVSGGSFTGKVNVFLHTVWPYSNHDQMALTTFCPSPAAPLNRFFMAIMEFNYQDFFTEESERFPDLRSVFLHELGHLLGLDHSCDLRSKDGFPLCSDTTIDSNYLNAVMFPSFSFSGGVGEKKRRLRSNDQTRANCLYLDQATTDSTTSTSN